jgi:hypothetical protein
MPASRRAHRRQRRPSSVPGRRSTHPWPRTTTPWCLHTSCLTMGSVGVVETVLPSIVCETRPASATVRRSSCARLIGEPAVSRLKGCSWKRARHRHAVSCAGSLPLGRLLPANSEPRGKGGSSHMPAVRGPTGGAAAVCTQRGRPHCCRGRIGRRAPALGPHTPGSHRGSTAIQNRPRGYGRCCTG